MRAIVINVIRSVVCVSVCVSVCRSVTTMICAETAERIEVPLGVEICQNQLALVIIIIIIHE